MKKIYAAIFALCLMCGTTALAAGNNSTTINQDSTAKTGSTTVSYTIDKNETYTVTIPSSVSLNGTDNLSGILPIGLKTDKFNVSGKTIAVKLTSTANNFNLVNGTSKIVYTLKASGKVYNVNDTLLSWEYGQSTTDQTLALVPVATVSSTLPAGDYTDTLTFNVSVTDNNTGAESEAEQ